MTIEQRLNQLEKSVNRWKMFSVSAILLLVVCLSVGADIDPFAPAKQSELKVAEFEEIRCKRLVVQDRPGEQGVTIANDGTRASIFIRSAKREIFLGVSPTMTGLGFNEDGKKPAFLMMSQNSENQFMVDSQDGKFNIGLRAAQQGATMIMRTLEKPGVTLLAMPSGGAAMIQSMDTPPKGLVLEPSGVRKSDDR